MSQAHARLLIQLPLKNKKFTQSHSERGFISSIGKSTKEEKKWGRKAKKKDHFTKEEEENLKKIVGIRCPNRPSKKRQENN